MLSNTRAALENLIKYGILVDPVQWIKIFIGNPSNWPTCQLLFFLNSFIFVAFFIEHVLKPVEEGLSGLISESVGKVLIGINVCAILLLPPVFIQYKQQTCNPVGASIACGFYSVVSLKVVSYHMVNYWCRLYQNKGNIHRRPRSNSVNARERNGHANGSVPNGVHNNSNMGTVTYPNNLTLKDLYYFMIAPTLCYQLNFPRSQRIRKRFLMKRIAEIVIFNLLFTCHR